jgi:hypothetical protein
MKEMGKTNGANEILVETELGGREGIATTKNGKVFGCDSRYLYGGNRPCPWLRPMG